MASVKTAWRNILEGSTVGLAGVSEDSSYPLSRLFDRNTGRIFKPASAATMAVKIDQGTSPVAVDRLVIPAGHNLSGMTLDIMWSEDDVTYTPAVAQWTGAAGVIDKSWAALTKRYWEFVITSPGAIPEITELFLTSTYTWPRNPQRPGGPYDPAFNIQRLSTAAGHARFLKMGAPKTRRQYHVRMNEAQKVELLSLYYGWGGWKPFWVWTETGEVLYAELEGPPDIKDIAYEVYSASFNLKEILP